LIFAFTAALPQIRLDVISCFLRLSGEPAALDKAALIL
jgi:hypothetical protein